MKQEIIITVRANGMRRVQLELEKDSHVEQSHVGSTNINAIMRRYRKTGEFPPAALEAAYGDFSGATDYHDAQNRILGAASAFMELPSEIRTRFGNDPGQLLDFMSDDGNLEEARVLGLVSPEPEGEVLAPDDASAPEGAPAASEKPPAGEVKPKPAE